MKSVGSAEEYISNTGKWEDALVLIREIFLSAGLEEIIKWGGPVYMYKGKNLVAMAAFKSYVAVWFYQGALLKDENNKLINAQEGITKALRQWRFSSMDEVLKERDLINEYIFESIGNIEQNIEIKPVKNSSLPVPPELESAFETSGKLKDRFDSLSLTNRKDYIEYMTRAKQEKTRKQRLAKIIPMIMNGEGLHDKYKK